MTHPPGNDTVVRIRRSPAGRDGYGDPGAATETRTDIAGCAVAPRSEDEPTDRGRTGVIVGLTLYAPLGTDLVHTDLIEHAGETYEIDGRPGAWANPFEPDHGGVEAALKMAEG